MSGLAGPTNPLEKAGIIELMKGAVQDLAEPLEEIGNSLSLEKLGQWLAGFIIDLPEKRAVEMDPYVPSAMCALNKAEICTAEWFDDRIAYLNYMIAAVRGLDEKGQGIAEGTLEDDFRASFVLPISEFCQEMICRLER